MNNLTIINQQEILGKDFKIYGTAENPLFLAKDVAEWIEHSNPRMMLNNIDEEDKVVNNVYTLGGAQQTWFLTEDGLYEVLMQSRKPIAKAFKKEVKKILKQIRQTGGYIPMSEEENDEDFLARALIVAQRTLARKEQRLKEEEERRKLAEQTIVEQAPKVEAYTQFMDSEGLINLDDTARLLNIGKVTMLKKLREKRILITEEYLDRYGRKRQGDNHNIPYQIYMKYFCLKTLPPANNGISYRKLYVRPNGIEYLNKKLNE